VQKMDLNTVWYGQGSNNQKKKQSCMLFISDSYKVMKHP
jgi:hypothetical protein